MLAQMCNDFIAQRWLLFVVTSASAHDFHLLLINNFFNLSYTGRPSPAPTANISEIYIITATTADHQLAHQEL